MPIPSFSPRPEKGTIIGKTEVSFIALDQTTRREVTNRLGAASRESCRMPAFAYAWELPGGQGVWFAACMYGGAAGEFEWTRWRAFFVLCDEEDRVAATSFLRLSSGRSLDEQLEKWGAKQQKRLRPKPLKQ